MGEPRPSIEDRFWSRVDKRGPDDCWLWTGPQNGTGYGAFSGGSRATRTYAHRWSYVHHYGPIPEGMEIDHTCHDPKYCRAGSECPHRRCVNPAHLRAVTHRENVIASDAPRATSVAHRSKTHCPQGHPYDEANTRWHWNRTYWNRTCIECKRKRTREYMRTYTKIKNSGQDHKQR